MSVRLVYDLNRLFIGSSAESSEVSIASIARAMAERDHFCWLEDGTDSDHQGPRWTKAHDHDGAQVLMCDATDVVTAFENESLRTELDRMASGGFWTGYVAYDATWSPGGFARRLATKHERSEPIARFFRYPARLVTNGISATIIADNRAQAESFARMLDELVPVSCPEFELVSLEVGDAAHHIHAIENAIERMDAGAVYQVNLARRWLAQVKTGNPERGAFALFEKMRAAPVPLGFFLNTGTHALCGRSMERFFSWDEPSARLETRPIKGTISRDETVSADLAERALRGDPKEHAEHVMIVDLMRNDLGQVAKAGSVRVERALYAEPYKHLFHLVSTIACETTDGTRLSQVMDALFPPGSVTGAPKASAVQIIEASETHPRGVYCGCYGVIDRGSVNFAVAIRTATVVPNESGIEVTYHAGGGIVESSVAHKELAETTLKARALTDVFRKATELAPCSFAKPD